MVSRVCQCPPPPPPPARVHACFRVQPKYHQPNEEPVQPNPGGDRRQLFPRKVSPLIKSQCELLTIVLTLVEHKSQIHFHRFYTSRQ